MRRYYFLLLFLLPLATPAGAVLAQEPTPTPAPAGLPFDNPIFQEGGPGLPAPFPLPDPDPDQTIDMAPLWDYGALYDSIRAVLTVGALVKRNMVIQVAIVIAVFALVMLWVVGMVRGREDNV